MVRHGLFLLLFALFFSSLAFADVQVSLVQLSDSAAPIYPLEIKYYKVVVLNLTDTELVNFNVMLNAPEEIALVIDGDERRSRAFTFLRIAAQSEQEKVFELKPLSATGSNSQLTAVYTSGDYNGSFSVNVPIAQKGVLLDGIPIPALKSTDQSKVSFTIANNTDENISNVRVELFGSDNIMVESEPFELDSLSPGQSVNDVNLNFSLSDQRERTKLLLRAFFDDSNGTHALEKPLDFSKTSSGGSGIYVLAIIAIILLLVIAHFYLKGKGNEPHESEHSYPASESAGGKWKTKGH